MIKLTITGRKYEVDKNLNKYITKKLAKLDRYLPRNYQAKALNVEVFRDETQAAENRYTIKAYLEVPGPDIVAEATTINPHSATDIVEQKLKLQIRKYKDKHTHKRFRAKEFFWNLRSKK